MVIPRFDGVESLMGKGEKMQVSSIFLLPTMFSRAVSLRMLTHSHTMTPFDAPGKQAF